MKNVCFICVNYNNSHFTIKYVDSIFSLNKLNDFNIKVVIVDNNSSEIDYAQLHEFTSKKEKVELIRNPENSGYFKGLNLGLKSINTKDLLFAVIGNNDLEFDDSFLDKLVEAEGLDVKKKVLAYAPNIINLDGDAQNPVSVNRLSLPRRLFLKIYFSNYYIGSFVYFLINITRKIMKRSSRKFAGEPVEIHLGYGACYVLTQGFFEHFSKLDDRNFLYGEEALIGNQIRSAGGVMVYLPDAKVKHFEHATSRNFSSRTNYQTTQEAYSKYKRLL